MDLPAPECIQNALKERIEHPVFGYTLPPDSLLKSIQAWQKAQHGWLIEKEWIQVLPGVVPTLGFCVHAFSEPGDGVIVQSPVYYPFYEVIEKNNRRIVRNPLKLENGRYTMDFEQLESVIDEKTKLLLLCSPHNPGGSVWNESELIKLVEICLKHKIMIVSDEIHADLVYPGAEHIPTAKISQEAAHITVMTSSAGKTFNIPGLNTSYVICANDSLRRRLHAFIRGFHLDSANLLGMVATEAAYNNGREWLEALLIYLQENISFVKACIEESGLPIRVVVPEATYLVWLDFREMGLDDESLARHLIEKAGVGLNQGVQFGEEGSGFMRLNAAAPRAVLEKALKQVIGSFTISGG